MEVVTGIFAITVFLAKMVLPSHQKAVGIQWDLLVQASDKAGGVTNLIANSFQEEVARVMNLPAEQQSEAIGKIAGNVLGMVGIAGAGAKAAKMGNAFLAKSAASKAAAEAARVAALAANENAVAANKAATIAGNLGNAKQAAALTHEATAHVAEAAKNVTQAAKLTSQAVVEQAKATGMKAGAVLLSGPAESFVSHFMTSTFNKAYLLIQAKKASPNTMRLAISKALQENAELKAAATASGDQVHFERLVNQETYLLNAQKKLEGLPVVDKPATSSRKQGGFVKKEPVLSKAGKSVKSPAAETPPVTPEAKASPKSETAAKPADQSPTEPTSKPVTEAKPTAEPPAQPTPAKPTPQPERIRRTHAAHEGKGPDAAKPAADAPFRDFTYDPKLTLTQNERNFRKLYHSDFTDSHGLTAEERFRTNELSKA